MSSATRQRHVETLGKASFLQAMRGEAKPPSKIVGQTSNLAAQRTGQRL